jgi:small subunit ribosomal protein S21
VISNVIQVRIKRGETVDRALKRLKKVLDKEGLMREIRNHRYFEKPSEQKRREKARARIRAKMQGR